MSDSAPPKVLWKTPAGRVVFDFQVMLDQMPKLISDDFLSELSRENVKITNRIRVSYAISLALAFLCYGLASGSSIDVNLTFVEVNDFSLSTSILVFIMGMVYYNYIINVLNSFIITEFMKKVTKNISEDAGLIYMTRWDASNLWIQTTSLRFVGYKSSFWHTAYVCIVLFVLLLVMLSIMVFCNIAAWAGFASSISDGKSAIFISIIGAISVTLSTLYFIMALCLPQKFLID